MTRLLLPPAALHRRADVFVPLRAASHARHSTPRRAMWTDHPGPLDYAPEVPYLGQGSVQMHGEPPSDGPVATIHLPNGDTHDVMPPPRERIGFRRA